MKNFKISLFIFSAALVCAGYFIFADLSSTGTHKDTTTADASQTIVVAVGSEDIKEKNSKGGERHTAELVSSTLEGGNIEYTNDLESQIEQMAVKYENVKADAQLRATQRNAMQLKLREYSELILPLALEKIEQTATD